MGQSLASLAYKGSIPEAIVEAKIQKKLFVVYISGEDADSIRMENSTWVATKVSETISKYCILLHVAAGGADATNFSRIYPQKSVPCITAVGYNGVQIWQNEGFIDAENLSSSLEKAWLSLHIQETTASVMAAALAGRTLESSTSGASPVALNEQGSSSNAVPPPSDGRNRSSEATTSLIIEEKRLRGESIKEETETSTEKVKEASSSTGEESHDSGHDNQKNMGNECPSSEANSKHLPEITEGSDSTGGSSVLLQSEEKLGSVKEVTETDVVQILPTSNKSSDVYLNIRLPDGISLQDKFPITSTLRIVKDYIDENRANGSGSYDLAVPYPRKVFNDQDLSKSLEELELLGRQALIVVPREKGRGNTSRGGVPIPYIQPDSAAVDLANRNNEGYFAFARRFLSYFNPFSYLGGGGSGASSSQGQESRASTSEYRPNTNLRSSYAAQERPNSQGSTSRDTIRSRKPTTSRFGSNIHTLKHDDDETQFRDRNAFWNGNSTEYGGDNNDSK